MSKIDFANLMFSSLYEDNIVDDEWIESFSDGNYNRY